MRTLTIGRTATRLTILLLLLLLAKLASAQVTTSAISGKISSDKNEDLIGVTVVATNAPTGTKRGTATEPDGRFTIPNLAPGGPYTVTVTYVGYKEQTISNVFLTLGNTTRLNFTLAAEAQALNEVVVVGNTQATKTGAGTNVSSAQLQQLPTISRSIQDFTRLDPRNSNNSFAGSSFRYNNITLDGAVNNDAIGFSPSLGGTSGTSGLPGSSARANPISLDAIQEIQASVAPFDVKLGNFTGGSINAVTRSGSNEFHGSVYGFGRNQNITGKSIDGTNSKIGSSYHDYQTGFRLGGPIIKNKLFFFTNAEIARRQEPQFYAAGAPGSPVSLDLAKLIADKLQTTYNYNVGAYGDYNIHANSDKIFARLDWNLDDKTSIALRHNYVKSDATNLERSGSLFKFGSQDYTQNNLQNSTVLEVKSNFSNQLANNLILGYTNIHDYRTLLDGPASVFPYVQINNVGASAGDGVLGSKSYFTGSNQILLGSDREASIFNTRTKTFEITDNVTFFAGNHTLTLGTHNELYKIDYGFINSWNGRIEYNNVSDFLKDQPNRIRGTYHLGDNSYDYNYNNPSASFNINLYSAYLQDEWNVTDRLKVSPGIRLDLTSLPSGPPLNSTLVNNPANDARTLNQTYSHVSWADMNNKLLGNVQVSPRLGFNYDVNGDQSVVLRGGTGLFTGRIPYAWLGYAFYNNGVNYNSVDLNNIQKGVIGAAGQPAGTGAGSVYKLNQDPNVVYASLPASNKATTEVDMIDPNFKMPQIWRSSLAVDFRSPTGFRASLEGLYTQVIQDVKFENINLYDNAVYFAQGPTQLPYYPNSGSAAKVNSQFSNAYLLTNTNQGYRYQLTGSVGQTVSNLLDLSVAYTYGVSKDISNGIRNSPESNWQLNPALNANNPALAYSNFDLRNRVVASINLHKSFAQRFTGYFTSVLTYSTGAPFTWVYNNNFFNNGGQQPVQLAYIPASATDISLVTASGSTYTSDASGVQYAALSNFIDNDPYLKNRRGAYAERNAAHTPWNNQADVRFMVEAKLGKLDADVTGAVPTGHTIQISFDIINVGNLLSNSWGRQYFVPNTFNSTLGTGLTQVGFVNSAGAFSSSYSASTATVQGYDRPAFTFGQPATYSIDQLASRWQGQLGVRYSF
ncbi:TonB-dependent receptor [Hymenobacter baengnokdamensis]|uniref:TonB-dependent receptor n=1 Tax=Hymenobacter baengnokdamensis TaxID=2615203 RepID=UPI0012456360|nr:TonB-dependent receptor [Hymenobacter baengnokdamensis]